jgi:hypothetical protein
LNGLVETDVLLAFEQVLFGVEIRAPELQFKLGVEGRQGALFGANLQSEIVRHPENPASGILDVLAFLQRDIQPQKDFLRRLLGLRRVKSQAEQVAIHVVTRFLKQLGHLVLQSHSRAFPSGQRRKLFTK